jgi:hypothetical protein
LYLAGLEQFDPNPFFISIRQVFPTQAPMDMAEKEALNLCGQPLDSRHYDLLVDKTGMVLTPTGEVLCILLKPR